MLLLTILLLAGACAQKPQPLATPAAKVEPAAAPAAGARVPDNTFGLLPLEQPVLSSAFGVRKNRMHKGVDFSAPVGSEVRAVATGVVTFAGRMSGYGRLVEIVHADGTATRYAHLASFGGSVAVGAAVIAGTVIGTVGTSGRTTGPNLHFEVLVANRAIDPLERLLLD